MAIPSEEVRERMASHRESYAAAHLALVRARKSRPLQDSAVPCVRGYQFAEPVETDTSLLASALAQSEVMDPGTGKPFDETQLFGLSGGIGFMYFVFEYKGHNPMLTFTCRSWSVPQVIVDNALRHAGIEPQRLQTGSAAKAQKWLDERLDSGRCVHASLDWASLPSSGVTAAWKGQMSNQANVVGRSGSEYLIDLGAPRVLNQAHLAEARGAVRRAKHASYCFDPGTAQRDAKQAVLAATQYTAKSFVEAPFKGFANNFGLAGLRKAAALTRDRKSAKGWPKLFSTPALAHLALARTWQCIHFELTAPGGGRRHYSNFLRSAAKRCALPHLTEAADLATQSAEQFEAMAEEALEFGGQSVKRSALLSERIAEQALKPQHPPGGSEATVLELRSERSQLAEQCRLTALQRLAAFDQLGSRFESIAHIESELQRVLARA